MKKFVQVIFVFLFVILVVETAFAQRTATHTLTNFNVNTATNKFSFDIFSIRTGGTSIRVGNTSYYMDYNFSALNNPVISNINTKYSVESVSGDYDLMTLLVVSNKLAVTISFNGNGVGTGELLSTSVPNGERICTITLDITNQAANANITWDLVNSAMQTPLLQPLVSTYEGSFNGVLPVELSSFTSKFLNDKVQLNWVTKTEVNNYGFNVERRINEGEWNSIGFIEGHGNSNSPKEYNYSDKDLFAGGSNFQYRLKQIDTDGQFEYSDVVEVDVVPTQFELSQNYPNPFNPTTTIRFSLPQATQIKINLYNMIGEQIATLAEGMYETGNHKVTFNAANLPSGAYIYRIESSDFVQVKKMILMK